MQLPFRKLSFALALCLSLATAQARVIRIEVLSRTTISGDAGLPDYEKVIAKIHFAVRSGDPHNRAIVDLDKAPLNASGEVEFSSDLFLMRPLSRANGALLLEIPNRGGKGLLSLVDGGKADPAVAADLGDGWLLRQGFAFASLGWQWDADGTDALRLYAPVAHDKAGKSIGGFLRDDFMPFEPTSEVPLGHIMGTHLGGREYPVATTDDPRNVLTVRESAHGSRRIIPRNQWAFAKTEGGVLSPNSRFLHLDSGFVPGRIYELVYAVRDPVVAGLGFAAVRDFVAWLKHAPDSIAPVHTAYAAGISQCGRFLRDFVYEGFNADESGKMALDGVLAHVGGAGRGSFNYRFAQPSRDAQPTSSIDWPTDVFPFTDTPEIDPGNPKASAAGLLDTAIAQHVVPKIFFSHTSYEYWGRAASLIHTTADGTADVPIGDNVRIYFFAGLQHFSVPFPPQKMTIDRASQQLPSPLPVRWFWRAMIANMDAWVRHSLPPPPSRYPHISDGTLVRVARLAFPAIPSVNRPANVSQAWHLDFGPNWQRGILAIEPPVVGTAFPTLVPQGDADGNDRGGIALPEITVPLATYTGWNLRDPAIGAPTERLAFLGSFIPFPETASEAAEAHDPRQPIEARYKDYADYRARFKQALNNLTKDRYLLPEDSHQLLDRSQIEWDWITHHSRPDK